MSNNKGFSNLNTSRRKATQLTSEGKRLDGIIDDVETSSSPFQFFGSMGRMLRKPGTGIGAGIGMALGGPVGALAGGAIGSLFNKRKPPGAPPPPMKYKVQRGKKK
tara:strand:+ start:41 stop:358 length:318 start_codon:yes stop_codon:yes gene_type:complete